jgi:hypothetical protein
VTNLINFQDGKFDSYSLTLEENLVKIDCYLLGSITGGTGTECGHTIEGPKIKRFRNTVKQTVQVVAKPCRVTVREDLLFLRTTSAS